MRKIFALVLMLAFVVTVPAFAAEQATEATTDVTLEELLGVQQSVDMQGQGCQGAPDPDCVCTTQYDPVCGCNGVTYSNSCYAQCDGVRQWTSGECA